MLVFAAAALGAAATPHCMGMCGPIAAAAGARRTGMVAYQVGRLASYATLGAIAGAIGESIRARLPGPVVSIAIALLTAIPLLVGARNLLRGREPSLVPASSLVRRRDPKSAVALGLGLVTGILPCGALFGALAFAATARSPREGALAMLVFGTTTALGLVVSQLAAKTLLSHGTASARRILATTLVAGAVLVLARPLVLIRNDGDGTPPCHATRGIGRTP